MIKVLAATILFVLGFFVLFQYPEIAVVFFPLSVAFLLAMYTFINAEVAILFGIFFFLASLGIINQLPALDKVHIVGGLISLVISLFFMYKLELRKTSFEKDSLREIQLLRDEIRMQDREKNQYTQTVQSLDMRGVLQKKMEMIVRDLAGTLDAAVIRKQMFVLVNNVVKAGKHYLVSGSANRDAVDEWVMRQRVPILSRDIQTDGRFLSKKIASGVQSLIVAPIVVQGKVEDILRIESEQKNTYDLTDLRVIELITLMTSVSLGNARLYKVAEARVVKDGLTDLFTQNYFFEKLQQELLFAQRYRTPTSIMMLDVDHFKNINDMYGHQTGDAVLKRIAGIIREAVYPIGIAARYGGEEFAVLFPQTGRIKTKEISEKILTRIAQESFDSDEYKGIRTTISMGIAVFPEDGSLASPLLKTADANLYRAKASGRNRLVG